MVTKRIIKLEQADHPDQPILVQVTPKAEDDVDVDLLATDGDAAYKGKVRQRNLKKLRSKNYEGSEDEWASIVSFAFSGKTDTSLDAQVKRNLEIKCTVTGRDPSAVLTISFVTRIEDITQRLGSIDLQQTPETDDIDVFSWTCGAISERDTLQTDLSRANQKAEEARSTIVSLQEQLTDLVKAKKEHEEELLTKFAVLLNEKKARIRNQQRILSSAKIDKNKLQELRLSMDGKETGHGKSRSKKRAAEQDQVEAEDDESDGFESMDVDKEENAEEDEEEDRQTTPGAETESDDDSLRAAAAPNSNVDSGDLPPPRTLPFARKDQERKVDKSPPEKSRPTSSAAKDANDDEETASEDDEL